MVAANRYLLRAATDNYFYPTIFSKFLYFSVSFALFCFVYNFWKTSYFSMPRFGLVYPFQAIDSHFSLVLEFWLFVK